MIVSSVLVQEWKYPNHTLLVASSYAVTTDPVRSPVSVQLTLGCVGSCSDQLCPPSVLLYTTGRTFVVPAERYGLALMLCPNDHNEVPYFIVRIDMVDVPLSMFCESVAGVPPTVTVTEAVVVPDAFVALIVYVVVTVGDTCVVPDADTEPTALSILRDVEFDTFQDSVTNCPAEIVAGAAVKEFIVGVGVVE